MFSSIVFAPSAPSDEAPNCVLDFAAARLKSGGKVIATKPVATKAFSVLASLIFVYAHPRGAYCGVPERRPKEIRCAESLLLAPVPIVFTVMLARC